MSRQPRCLVGLFLPLSSVAIVLSSYVIDELHNVTGRKFKGKVTVVDALLSQIPYEMVYTPKKPPPGLFEIRAIKDYPVLYSAIAEAVDILIAISIEIVFQLRRKTA